MANHGFNMEVSVNFMDHQRLKSFSSIERGVLWFFVVDDSFWVSEKPDTKILPECFGKTWYRTIVGPAVLVLPWRGTSWLYHFLVARLVGGRAEGAPGMCCQIDPWFWQTMDSGTDARKILVQIPVGFPCFLDPWKLVHRSGLIFPSANTFFRSAFV